MIRKLLEAALKEEDGHWVPFLGAIVAAAGAIVLAIGAANDENAIIIVGGIVLAVGILGYDVARHMNIDYDIYRRFEGKK